MQRVRRLGPRRVDAHQEHARRRIRRTAKRRRCRRSTRSLRPGDAPDAQTAKQALERLFFSPKRYDLGRVGHYKINQRLGLNMPADCTVLTKEDFIAIIRYLVELHEGRGHVDDIDHLGNRRIRSVGELDRRTSSRSACRRMARLVKERMSITPIPEKISLDDLVNARTVSAVIQAFFGSAQLSQFMDQPNPLAEVTHKRRLSALGPGGLTRERAGFEVRDVHYSQYGRMCPIETPEGPNIGLITSLACYAQVNDLGFVETPYYVVKNGKVLSEVAWLDANQEEARSSRRPTRASIARQLPRGAGARPTAGRRAARAEGSHRLHGRDHQRASVAPALDSVPRARRRHRRALKWARTCSVRPFHCSSRARR